MNGVCNVGERRQRQICISDWTSIVVKSTVKSTVESTVESTVDV